MKHFATKLGQLKDLCVFGRAVFVIATGLLLLLSYSPLAYNIEQGSSLPILYSLRGPISPPENLAIIALNSTAAQNLKLSNYSGNWPRTIHAQLIDKLKQAQAKLIVMDIAFKDAHSEEEDMALQTALGNSNNVILFTYLKRHQLSLESGSLDIEQEIPPIPRFEQHALASASFTLPKYPALVYNTHLFSSLPSGIEASQPLLAYLAQLQPQNQQGLWDLVTPTTPMPTQLKQQAKQLIALSAKIDPSKVPESQQKLVKLLQHSAPLTINFYGYPKTIFTIPIDQALLLEKERFQHMFRGKTVYVGFSDSVQTEQQDAYRTIFSDSLGVDISGVEISATVFANLRDDSYIRQPKPFSILLITLCSILICLACYSLPFRWNICAQILVVTMYIILAQQAFNHYHWLPLTMPFLAITLANAFKLTRRFSIDKNRAEHIQFTLSQYLPNDAAKTFSRNVTVLEQQRKLVHGVCLMTDIQGYTSLSETLEPDELHELMNAYYSELVETVEAHGGFIGNLVGDGMLALWTGSEITTEMCQSAFLAVQQIQTRVCNNPKLKHDLPTCSALHGGQFSLGNLGAKGHFEYSPVGDIINTVSRVEHFNRNLGTRFLCTAPIAEKLALLEADNKVQLQYLGRFTFRHKSMAMPLYGLSDDNSADQQKLYEQAVKYYENHDFENSKKIFEKLREDYQDPPSKYYLAEMDKMEATASSSL